MIEISDLMTARDAEEELILASLSWRAGQISDSGFRKKVDQFTRQMYTIAKCGLLDPEGPLRAADAPLVDFINGEVVLCDKCEGET